jgi:hypothetical protein
MHYAAIAAALSAHSPERTRETTTVGVVSTDIAALTLRTTYSYRV